MPYPHVFSLCTTLLLLPMWCTMKKHEDMALSNAVAIHTQCIGDCYPIQSTAKMMCTMQKDARYCSCSCSCSCCQCGAQYNNKTEDIALYDAVAIHTQCIGDSYPIQSTDQMMCTMQKDERCCSYSCSCCCCQCGAQYKKTGDIALFNAVAIHTQCCGDSYQIHSTDQ